MLFAAIDIGSNAIRLLISEVKYKKSRPFFKKRALVRLPIRLGEDVFSKGKISKDKLTLFIEGLKGFSSMAKVYKVKELRAYATSAFRESQNQKEVAQEVFKKTGISIQAIPGEKEAELIHNQEGMTALSQEKKTYIYVDIGGGSTEISLFKKGKVASSKSFKLGTVRILQGKDKPTEWTHLEQYVKSISENHSIEGLIGTGGTVNKYAKIIGIDKKDPKVHREAFLLLYKQLSNLSYIDRVEHYQLNPDRADVIVPAGYIFEKIFKYTKATYLYVPKVGLADGMIREMYQETLAH